MDNIFQSKEWEKFKLATGYQKSYRIDDILVLQKHLPLGFSMLYAPRVTESQSDRVTKKYITEIRKIARLNKAIFFRLELNVPEKELRHSDTPPALRSSKSEVGTLRHFAKSFEEMQPEHTLVLNLAKSEEEILAQMKPKGRYNIRIAEREGIQIEKSENVDAFYQMYSQTAKRHKITYRSKSYFQKLLEILGKSGYASVYDAYIDQSKVGKSVKSESGDKIPLASAIVVYSGKTAIYMFGSSSDEYKNLMAPYEMHWQIIKEAKEAGYKLYDFFGIAPDDNPAHPWAGVTRFKKQYGGRQVDILGSYDLVFKPVMYQLFKIAEKIRR